MARKQRKNTAKVKGMKKATAARARGRSQRKAAPKNVAAVPQGYQTVNAYLVATHIEDVSAKEMARRGAEEFAKQARQAQQGAA